MLYIQVVVGVTRSMTIVKFHDYGNKIDTKVKPQFKNFAKLLKALRWIVRR